MVKTTVGKILLVVVGLVLGTAITITRQYQKDMRYTGTWTSGDGTTQLAIRPDHTISNVPINGNMLVTARWSATGDGIELSNQLPGFGIYDRYYAADVKHNGKTLRLTSEHGDVLVFERVGN